MSIQIRSPWLCDSEIPQVIARALCSMIFILSASLVTLQDRSTLFRSGSPQPDLLEVAGHISVGVQGDSCGSRTPVRAAGSFGRLLVLRRQA